MKKICILLAFVLCCVAVQAQSTCKVQGVVRYYYNDTFKYRPDLGAEIRFIPKTKQDTIPSCDKWDEYENKSRKVVNYLLTVAEWKDEGIYSSDKDSMIRGVWGVEEGDVERVKSLSEELFTEVLLLLQNEKYMTVVDNNGSYNISIPQGEYYVVMKSANRDRPFMAELLGRIYVKEVSIESPTKVISHDFEL